MALALPEYRVAVLPELRTFPLNRRVRATWRDRVVVDSTSAWLVWEPWRALAWYAVPTGDVALALVPGPSVAATSRDTPIFHPHDFETHTCSGTPFTVDGLGEVAFGPDDPDLAGRVLLDFSRLDWTEEDTRVVGHPHDPFQRIDVLDSSRHVVVSVGGAVLADTHRARALAETLLPLRWYVPPEDVRTDLLVPSETRSTCAYKGFASYWSLASGDQEDVAWSYPEPLPDAARVRGYLCFWSERTDLVLDGEPLPRPSSPWSR